MPTTGTSTAGYAQVATATTPFATTSAFYTNASYTPTVALTVADTNDLIVYPSTYVNFAIQPGTYANTGGYVMAGVCTATFQTIN
jgi:hypothetical protein